MISILAKIDALVAIGAKVWRPDGVAGRVTSVGEKIVMCLADYTGDRFRLTRETIQEHLMGPNSIKALYNEDGERHARA